MKVAGPRSMVALFGEDADTPPLWFEKEAFMAPDFNSEKYIADLRKFVALDTIRVELRSHLGVLKNELVELINRDYTDFVNLTTKLVDVDGAVLRMRMPLNELRGKLEVVRNTVQSSLAALQDGLRRRMEASESREILEHLLDTSHVLSKIEKLLVELQTILEGGAATSAVDVVGMQSLNNGAPGEISESVASLEESRSRLLERIASEMNRLKFYIARAQDLPFIHNMEKRIESAGAMLDASLCRCFQIGLECRDEAVIYRCLRAYAAIDNIAGAQEVFRLSVVAPILQQVIPLRDTVEGNGDKLEEGLEELQKLIEGNCKFLLDIAAADSGMHAFDFLGNSILKELHLAIQSRNPGALSPGKPAEFLANYKASLKFLDYLEGYCKSKSAIIAFRSEPAYADFLKLWNLGVYFTLRFQEIASALENSLTMALSPVQNMQVHEVDSTFGLLLKPSVALLSSLEQCWHADVYVPSLSDKFFSLTLQLLSRYSTWLSAGLAARRSGNAASGGEWALVVAPEDFLLIRYDVELLARKLQSSYIENVLSLFEPRHTDVSLQVKRSILQGVKKLLDEVPCIDDVMVEALAKKCMEVLMQLKGITATYRMTNKPLPVRHSPYVSGILQPLKVFLEGENASYLSKDLQTELVTAITERVTARFDELARELVTLAKKTESSLKRLRRAAGADSNDSNISDTDKICMQLYLDVQEYGRRLGTFEISAAALPAYTSLWQCVAPPDKQTQIQL
eukprot:c27163_g1_i1 orf=404-2626(-)